MDNKSATLELGTQPVGKLLMKYAFPAIVAMTASSLYNMVDSIFIGHMGQDTGALAISGLAVTFPFMNLSGAFGAAIGVGSATLLSVRLGQKDYSTAVKLLGNCVSLNVITGILFGVICLSFLEPILRFFGASDQTLPYAREYMQIILAGNAITHLYLGMNALLRSASKPRHAMAATLFTVIFNTLLDPLFIFVFNMGIRGAAIATILAQFTALCWQCRLFSHKDEIVHFEKGTYVLDLGLVRNIIGIGMSPFLMHSAACMIVIILNKSLYYYGGDLAVGAYGIVNRISFLFFMVIFGLNQGMQPIAGYNYGAMHYDRMLRVLKYTMIAATVVSLVGWMVTEILPYYCAILFTPDTTLVNMAIRGLRIANIAFPVLGGQIVITNFFQSIGKAKVSIFLSLSRQLLFLLPLLLLLPRWFGLDGVWASLSTSDFIAAMVALTIMQKYMRQFSLQQKLQQHE